MSRRSKKPAPKRQSENPSDLLRRVRAKKRRRTIVIASFIALTLIAVIIAGIILNPAQPEPGTLVVHIYDAAIYQPPACPSPISTLPVKVTVTLNGPRSAATPNVLGLVAYSAAPPGSYQVTATAAGYTQDSANASVTSGNTIHVCLALAKTG